MSKLSFVDGETAWLQNFLEKIIILKQQQKLPNGINSILHL